MSTDAKGNCFVCQKKVYPTEAQTGHNDLHKSCFKCSNCNCKLNLATYKKVEGKLYCPTHVPVERKNVVGTAI